MDARVGTQTTATTDGRRALVAAGALVGLVVVLDVWASWASRDEAGYTDVYSAMVAIETLSAATVGLLIVRAQSRNVVGWLLLAHALSVALVLDGESLHLAVATDHLLTQLTLGCWPLLYVWIAVIAYVVPDGHFLSRRWRRFLFTCLAGYAVFMVVAVFSLDDFHAQFPGVQPPIPIPPDPVVAVLGVLALVCLAAIAASLVGAVVCVNRRLKQTTGVERQRMLWVAWGALSIPAGLALCWLDFWITGTSGWLTFVGVTVFGTLLPLSIGIAILREQLFDIELVLSRTLTYGVLTAAVVLTYALVLQGVGAVADQGAAGLVAVAVVAIAIQPAHAWVRRRVERWVYGDRSDPFAALTRLSLRLEAEAGPERALETVADSVREALRAQRVALDLRPGSAEPVPADATTVRAPMVYQGQRLGDLVVELPQGRTLSAADRRVLDGLARHAAVVVNAVALTLDLQASRAQIVTAREEERRRLRRDLHDGLGPSLAAIVLKLGAATSLADDPDQAHLLEEVRAEARAAVGEIRRLVDDLRPPALDEVGLVGALRQRAASLSRGDVGGTAAVLLEVAGPDVTGPLPAAVEVAAYRIGTEAMTNVVRHSGAARGLVTLSVNGALELSVSDNGDRPWGEVNGGVGWASMRERAAELGGSCTISRRPEGGTLVHAVLPLGDHAEHGSGS